MKLQLKLAILTIALGVVSSESPTLTGPSGIIPTVSKENTRFSRLLHQNAAALQFSSISNLAPPLPGISKDLKNHKKKATLSSKHLGRRTLDYDGSVSEDERIITEPQPGNEYVYIRQGGIQTEEQQAAAASVTSINRQPANQRIPFTLLRQSNGKRVNISPVFSPQEQSSGFENPIFHQNHQAVPSEREYELASEDTTAPIDTADMDVEATTSSSVSGDDEDHLVKRQMIVNVVTSEPRVEYEDQNKTTPVIVETTTSTTTAKPVEVNTIVKQAVAGDSHNRNPSADLKENLLVQSTRRIGSFPDFEDSPTRLQTAESNAQPARVNVRPASSGKEYEYEYIYYYYDDDDEDNSTSKANGTNKAPGAGRGTTSGVTPTPLPSHSAKPEADFDDEELEEFEEEEVPEVSKVSPTPVKAVLPTEPKAPVVEKFSNSNPINQLDRSRSPKQAFSSEKVVVPEVDYKLESGDFQQYEEEDEQVHLKAKGQPHRPPPSEDSEDEEPEAVAQSPEYKVTSTPTTHSTASNQDSHSTMAKSHPDSVNSPVILKQSNILQSVPASRLQPQTEAPTRGTSPLTPSTTTTEAASETPSTRAPSSPRFRGQQRIRGGSTSEAAKVRQQLTTEQAVSEQPEEAAVKPSPASHRTFNKDSIRRTPSRRPQVESSQAAPESPAQVPASSQDTPVRNPVRTRFPARISPTSAATTTTEPVVASKSPVSELPAVIVQETNEQQAKENYVRRPALIKGSSSSVEQSTDAPTSSEATTLPPSNIEVVHSNEQAAPVTSTTTTTTTTTEAVPLDKFGKPRNRFSRTRRPLTASANVEATSTTEATVSSVSRVAPQNRNRFSGRRKPSTPVPHTDETKQTEDVPSTSSGVSEAPKPRIPSRNRFATRNRGQSSTTEGTAHDEEKKEVSNSEPTVASSLPVRRNKPIFQGRRRNPSIGSQNATTTASQDETAAVSTSAPSTVVKTGDDHEVKRPGGLPNVQRRRPGAGPRIRGGRLGVSTTTTEAPATVSNVDSAQEQPADIEQSPTSQSEQLEPVPSVSSSVPSVVESTNQRGNVGVVGRLRTRPKLATTTTTAAPEPVLRERKPSRLNGILNRRKPGPLTTTAVPQKEESKVEAQEEANNNAKEQEDSQHKGVVVQVSSSVTESEEKHEHVGEEDSEQSSTTAASILNRLKSQRKPGSIFRKRTDPHGE